ncbi:hypothetical protein PR048_007565 [Dryococelus australis]|uniref:Uncharacterized protein n=1 Tax=Dryococelus australis TaxID=614101 RepID=A0ABQ9HUL0_9NEOP|nr:hypothetical protein PR048_007565 [Dryococelus australis]
MDLSLLQCCQYSANTDLFLSEQATKLTSAKRATHAHCSNGVVVVAVLPILSLRKQRLLIYGSYIRAPPGNQQRPPRFSHVKLRATPLEIDPSSPWWEVISLTGAPSQPPPPINSIASFSIPAEVLQSVVSKLELGVLFGTRRSANLADGEPPTRWSGGNSGPAKLPRSTSGSGAPVRPRLSFKVCSLSLATLTGFGMVTVGSQLSAATRGSGRSGRGDSLVTAADELGGKTLPKFCGALFFCRGSSPRNSPGSCLRDQWGVSPLHFLDGGLQFVNVRELRTLAWRRAMSAKFSVFPTFETCRTTWLPERVRERAPSVHRRSRSLSRSLLGVETAERTLCDVNSERESTLSANRDTALVMSPYSPQTCRVAPGPNVRGVIHMVMPCGRQGGRGHQKERGHLRSPLDMDVASSPSKTIWHAGRLGRGKREISEKTLRPAASSGTIPMCKTPRSTTPRIEPSSTWLGWGSSSHCAITTSQIICFPSRRTFLYHFGQLISKHHVKLQGRESRIYSPKATSHGMRYSESPRARRAAGLARKSLHHTLGSLFILLLSTHFALQLRAVRTIVVPAVATASVVWFANDTAIVYFDSKSWMYFDSKSWMYFDSKSWKFNTYLFPHSVTGCGPKMSILHFPQTICGVSVIYRGILACGLVILFL